MSSLSATIERIDLNISSIAKFHERALVGVSQDETNRITRQLDDLQDETNDMMDSVRNGLKKIADETKRMGKSSEAKSRKAQQSSAAVKLQNAAQRYAQVQKYAKEQYKKRIEREIKIGKCSCLPSSSRCFP
jgi:t-SNARE complex subunit (syntaxin)